MAGTDAPVIKVDFAVPVLGAEASLAAYVLANGLVTSNTEFKTLLKEGAIYLNEKRIDGEAELPLNQGENVVRIGKRKYLKLVK